MPGLADLGQARSQQQADQQGDDEKVRLQRAQHLLGVRVAELHLLQLGLGDAEGERGQNAHRRALQFGDHDDGECLEHDEREPERRQLHAGCQQHPGEPGEAASDAPADGRDTVGVHPGQLRQLPPVDDGPNVEADARVPAQQPSREPDHHEDAQDLNRAGEHRRPARQFDRPAREDRRCVQVGLASPHLERDAHQQDEHTEGGDQRLRGPRSPVAQRPEHQQIGEQPEPRPDDEDGQRGRDLQRPAPSPHGLPQQVGGHHREGAVGEVEDAGRPVGDEQPEPGQRGDRADGQARPERDSA